MVGSDFAERADQRDLADLALVDLALADLALAEMAELAAALARIVVALRTTQLSRLRASVTGQFGSRADAGRALAAALATAAQGIDEADAAIEPAWRRLPVLPDLAVGDQVAVTAHDLLSLMTAAPDTVWTPSGRASLSSVLADVRAMVGAVGALW